MLFPITSYPLPIHALFEAAAIAAGARYYRKLMKASGVDLNGLLNGKKFAVLLGCLFGAAVGNKLVFWLEMPNLFPLYWGKPAVWFAGQSMVGGLLGGLLGVELAKKWSGVRYSTGDKFVFPVLLGVIIGRIGCFVAGLDDGTFGNPTSLPWGVDFGDGIPRHPTQLYEILFVAVLWLFLKKYQSRFASQSGLLFKIMLCAYLCWRLIVDAIKPLPFDYGLGLSGIQVTCAVALFIYLPLTFSQWQKLKAIS
jgi:phosphatidylglycerol:prolipoprotein diacylglycerol transferase